MVWMICISVLQKPAASTLVGMKKQAVGFSETLVHTYPTHGVTL